MMSASHGCSFLGAFAIQLRKVTASLIMCVHTEHLHYEAVLAVVNYQITFQVIRYGAISNGDIVNFRQPTFKSTLYQRDVTNIGIKIYTKLPPKIKNATDNSNTFKTLLNKFLNSNSFDTLDEYL
jgi:hypothetical protein